MLLCLLHEVLIPGAQAFALFFCRFELGGAGIGVIVLWCPDRRRLGLVAFARTGFFGLLRRVGGRRFGDRGFEGGDDSRIDRQREFLVFQELRDRVERTAFGDGGIESVGWDESALGMAGQGDGSEHADLRLIELRVRVPRGEAEGRGPQTGLVAELDRQPSRAPGTHG